MVYFNIWRTICNALPSRRTQRPGCIAHGRRLRNGSGIGLVELDLDGLWRIRELLSGGQMVSFARCDAELRWD